MSTLSEGEEHARTAAWKPTYDDTVKKHYENHMGIYNGMDSQLSSKIPRNVLEMCALEQAQIAPHIDLANLPNAQHIPTK